MRSSISTMPPGWVASVAAPIIGARTLPCIDITPWGTAYPLSAARSSFTALSLIVDPSLPMSKTWIRLENRPGTISRCWSAE